ncbi:MAG: LLM class F420-dependent oxidoreductase [Gammaproteobacteria bacterium]|nr:LLM class F420-dependent oxidoreductase [Gammaproteobacteria bacterium]
MQIGISTFPTNYSIDAVTLGRAAEERGFESLFVVEHTHIPASRRTPYPPGGDLPSIYWESYEPFTYLAQVAAVTEHLNIGTGICLVPEHHPISLAKTVASLDSLSKGRFLFGVGAGWNAEELENHGVAYNDRWLVLEEHIHAMKACWTQKDAEYHGDFVDFAPIWVEPKPARQPHPPILIGASSRWAVERVVAFADGWLPVMMPDFAERLAQLDARCDEQQRARSSIDVSVFAAPEDPKVLAHLAKLGVNRVIALLPTLDEAQSIAWLDQHAALVAWAEDLG